MINIETISPHAHQITVMAEFRQADVAPIVAFAKERNAAGGGGNLLIDVTSMAAFSWSAVLEELGHMPMLMKCFYGFDRIAIISDEKWIRTAARLESALLPGIVYQVYDDDEADAARAWVLEQTDNPHKNAFRELDIGKPGIAAFELTGRLGLEESERGVGMVRAALESPDCSRLMIVIKNWHGFDPDTAISREVMAGKIELMKNLDRYAIVGGPAWVRSLASVVSVMVQPDIQSFELEEQDAAIAWLSE